MDIIFLITKPLQNYMKKGICMNLFRTIKRHPVLGLVARELEEGMQE
jgi:hypothetical protein